MLANRNIIQKVKIEFFAYLFFGDNANAIKIQSWCALIAMLLLDVTHKASNSTVAFSIIATIIMFHIINYVNQSAIIDANKLKRKRFKKNTKPNHSVKKKTLYFSN